METTREQAKNSTKFMEEFMLFVVSILGLSSATANSYVKYIQGVCKTLRREFTEETLTEIASTREALCLAEQELKQANIAPKTASNYISALRAYNRYRQGAPLRDNQETERCDIPFEVRKQLNEVEFRLSDGEAAFWHRILDVSLIVFTLFPALLSIGGCVQDCGNYIVATIVLGFFGILCLMPILRRPIRQSKEILDYGKKFASGEVNAIEILPVNLTPLERISRLLAALLIILSFICIIITIIKEVMR